MKLSELIAHVGDENVQMQNLSRDFDEAKVRGTKAQISFHTDPEKVMDMHLGPESEWHGIILWLPRKRLPKSEQNTQDEHRA